MAPSKRIVPLWMLCVLSGISVGCRGGATRNAPVTSQALPAPVLADAGDPAALNVVLDEPRFREARGFERKKEYADALIVFDAARASNESHDEACARDYVAARLASLGTNPADAALRFEKVAPDCPLASYAKLRAAQAHLKASEFDAAISRAGEVGEGIATRDDAKAVVAEANAANGKRALALPYWRELSATLPKGPKWADTNIRIATALLEGDANDVAQNAAEAFQRLTQVFVEAPKSAELANVPALRTRARSAMSEGNRPKEELTLDERGRRAAAWLEASEEAKAIAEANVVLANVKTIPKDAGASLACRAAVTKANAQLRSTPKPTVDVWADAITLCEKDETFAQVLFSAGKASAQQKRDQEAIARFQKVQELFPHHRLADDARLKEATIVSQAGEADKALALLSSLPDTYPEGDMRGEALFRAALTHIKKNEWAEAVPLLDRINVLFPDDRHWGTRGRADYFRARAFEVLGQSAEAEARYASILERHPLAFYMLLAHARLVAKSPSLAAERLKVALAKDVSQERIVKYPEAERPEFGRALRLLEVGEIEPAKREFAKAGATADNAPNELLWIVGAAYNRAGAPDLGHSFFRTRVNDFLSHYPEGAWRTPWEVAFPKAFEPLVAEASRAQAIPLSLAWGIMREESSFVVEAKSPSNAYGLMQLIVPTAKWMAQGTTLQADEASLKKPEVSIAFGTKLLGKLRITHAHPALAIGAYNSGSGAVNRWVTQRSSDDFDVFTESIPYDETRNYVKRVLASQAAYAYLYEPSSLDEVMKLPLSVVR